MSILPLRVVPPADPARRDALASLLRGRFETLEAAAVRCRGCDDAEAIHDLRVAARRLESALDVWRHALRDRPRRRARAIARRLRRDAGPAREREVCAALLDARVPHAAPGHRAALEALARTLGTSVDRGRVRVAKLVSGRRLARLTGRLERALRVPEGAASVRVTDARERVSRRQQAALEQLVEARATLDDARLHAARIAVKRWRYAEESHAAVARTDAAPLAGLRDLQRVLGHVHDAAVLRDLLLAHAEKLAARGDGANAAVLAAEAVAMEAERRALAAPLREGPVGPAGR